MVFHWSLSDSKSPQVSRTLLRIMAGLNKDVVRWHSFVLRFSTFFALSKPVGIVPSAPITIGIIGTLMFHRFFSSRERSKYLFLVSLFLIFPCGWRGRVKSTRQLSLSLSLSFLVIFWIWCRDLIVSQNPREFYVSCSKTDSGLCIYHLAGGSNLIFLHNSSWITFSTQSYLVLYLCASLLYLLIM